MLVFTFDCDIKDKGLREKLERELSERTGQKCVAVFMCSGAIWVPPIKDSTEAFFNQADNATEMLNQ